MSQRKQIMFDLDTKALEKYYPTKNWRNAYEDIKKHMLNNGFEWQQGSGYHSEKGLSLQKVNVIIETLVEQQPWLNLSVRDMQVGDLPKLHSLNHNFKKDFEMPTREEALNQISKKPNFKETLKAAQAKSKEQPRKEISEERKKGLDR